MRVHLLREWINVNLDPFPVVCSVGHFLSLSHTHTQICRENIVLLADSKLDLLHTVLSRCVKSVLEWQFLEERFICSFSDLHLLQSWFFILIFCTCTLALHSYSFSKSNLGKISPTLFQLKCTVTPLLPLPALPLIFLMPVSVSSLFHLSTLSSCFYMAPCSMYEITLQLMQTMVFFKQHTKPFLIH